jgi:hypothetical protein
MLQERRLAQPIYVEDWGAGYGSPYLVDDDSGDTAEGVLIEDGDRLLSHRGVESDLPEALAFVDGVRRAEAWLSTVAEGGRSARGLAGAFATGAVLALPGRTPTFVRERVQRLAIWESGFHTPLPEAPGGWCWEVASIADTDPDAPLAALQSRMREAERALALGLAAEGPLIVLDGPLNFVLGRDARVTGYVKTHHRRFLAADAHARVPQLALGERTSLFSVGERFSCYARIAAHTLQSPPWSGIVRLDLAGEDGLDEAKRLADTLSVRLPRFAGVRHCDPRAPQNLQPIAALEAHLRHLMGDVALATRAVRDAALTRTVP